MFAGKNVKLGIAPIAWTNDDLPELGGENTFQQCVSEMALAGFAGSEVGNKYPKDPAVLKPMLDLRGIEICNAWFSTFLISKPYEETLVEFETHDGTGVRDYIHVVDLAIGHVKALDYLNKNTGVLTVNLGTGIGYSVLDVVKAYEEASGVEVKYEIVPRRPGDIATCYANAEKAWELLGWKTERDLAKMCQDSWNFAKNNM